MVSLLFFFLFEVKRKGIKSRWFYNYNSLSKLKWNMRMNHIFIEHIPWVHWMPGHYPIKPIRFFNVILKMKTQLPSEIRKKKKPNETIAKSIDKCWQFFFEICFCSIQKSDYFPEVCTEILKYVIKTDSNTKRFNECVSHFGKYVIKKKSK